MGGTTIESAEHQHGGWTRATRPAAEPLRPLLDRDPVGFADHGSTPLSWVDVPSTSVTVILSCGEPYAGLPRAFVAGLTETWSVVDLGACGASIDLKLSPLGAYELLGVPMDELTGRVIDLGEVLGPELDAVLDRLAATDDWEQRLDLAEGLFAARAAALAPAAPEIAWAWGRLVATGGRARIGELAREVGWSHRHLIASFRRQVGLAPKTAARVIRFRGLLDGMASGAGLADLAYDHGYSDQAHLNRDFREFAGTTPSVWEAGVNFVQDG
jgi:AraC-like DNA-binding protein